MHRALPSLALMLALLLPACASASEAQKDTPPAAPSASAQAASAEAAPAPTSKNVQRADIAFKPFDPNKPEGVQVYPVAGNPKAGAFTAVVRLPAGHMAPLHTHTASHTGVTLTEGVTHGASEADNRVLPKGSTWRQPGGEPHVGGCQSETPCDMLVFFDGPVDMATAEAPAAKPALEMTTPDALQWREVKGGVKMAVIHGNPKEGAFQALFEFPAGMTTNVHTHTASFSGALLSGTHHRGPSPDALDTLTEGAVWSEPAGSPHMEKCGAEKSCVLVGAFDGPLDTQNVELTPASDAPSGS